MFLNEFYDFRLFYQKKGRIRYISHLDMNRCMQRMLQRSNLPIWYTQGFHPHPYITFALPLSLGFESEYECMDFRLVKDLPYRQIESAIEATLPEGLILLSVKKPNHAACEISFANYKIDLLSKCSFSLKEKLEQFLKQDQILVEKKTKKGKKIIDLKEQIRSYQFTEGTNSISLTLSLPAGERMINPTLLIKAFQQQYSEEEFRYKILRLGFYTADEELFQ